MRYWVYKDSRIMGPLTTEELSHVEGASSELLLCPEGADGGRESDWRTAGEIPELAGVLPEPAQTAVGLLEAESGDFDDWPIHGLSAEEIDSLRQFPSAIGGPWLGTSVKSLETPPTDRRYSEEIEAQ